MVDSDRQFLELRLPKDDEYQAWLEWKRQQEDHKNEENDQRVIIIEI